jgi:hypothetical protein
MPISLALPRAIDVVRTEANSFKILGFEVHTETEVSADDRVVVRKEARATSGGRVTSRTPMRVTEYTAETMLPVLADIARKFAGGMVCTMTIEFRAMGDHEPYQSRDQGRRVAYRGDAARTAHRPPRRSATRWTGTSRVGWRRRSSASATSRRTGRRNWRNAARRLSAALKIAVTGGRHGRSR